MTNRTDNFNRADSTTALGTPSDGGSDWIAINGTWGISSNQGYKVATDANSQRAVLESSVSNVDVQATLAGNATSGGGGLVCRLADVNNLIVAAIGANNLVANIFKIVAGSATQLGSTYT